MHSFLQPVFNCQGTSITKTGAERNPIRLLSPLILAVCSAAWTMDNPLKMEAIPARPFDSAREARGAPGGADRDRTDEPLLAKQVLSQLSYSPGSEEC